jgi:glycosyltransferase involved in cell wall biosynthesis
MRKEIVMIGTAPETRSGISAVVSVYIAHGLFRRWSACYIATHSDGSKLRKALAAIKGWARFMARLLAGRVALLHVLAASGPSFWRKALFIVPARIMGVPYVFHVHCGRFVDFYRNDCGPWAKACVRAVFRHAAAVGALSEDWRDELSTIEQARFAVVPNPVELPTWRASLDGSPPTVLFLGVVKDAKGVQDLLRAWPAVLEAVPGARLVLGGSGDLDAAQRLAAELGVQASVSMPGWVVGEAKSKLLRETWVFALPSHSEALPMSVLEAMAAGIPVVASRVGAIPLAVEDGRSGVLIEPRDASGLAQALIGLLADPVARHAMGRAARKLALKQFSADVMVPRLEALWSAMVPQLEADQTGSISPRWRATEKCAPSHPSRPAEASSATPSVTER